MTVVASDAFFDLDPDDVRIAFGEPVPQSRVTVAFRPLLVLPHVVVLVVLGAVAIPLAIIGWFAALILGRLPRWIAVYEMSVLAYWVRVSAYGLWLAGKFPPFAFSPGDYEVEVEVGASRLSRLKVLFRWLLFIPAWVVTLVATNGLVLFTPILWIVTLILGRMPRPFFGATAAVIRYQTRYYAYGALITDAYPNRLFGDQDVGWDPQGSGSGLRLTLSKGARRLMPLILILGVVNVIGGIVLRHELGHRRVTSPALTAAVIQLESASTKFQVGTARCAHKGFRCLQRPEHAWGEAFNGFGSKISTVPFSGSQQAEAAALVGDAHALAHELLAASSAKTQSAHNAAYARVVGEIGGFETDSQALLGVRL